MKHHKGARSASVKQKLIVGAVAAACSAGAFAIELDIADGWRASLNTTLSVGSSWRAESADKSLLNATNAIQNGLFSGTAAQAVAAGYTGGATDDYNQNYQKGDQYSELYKVLSEFTMTDGTSGGVLRVKGWYDRNLNRENVPWGNQSSHYTAQDPLSDRYMSRLNKFDGLELMDAYAYTSFDVADMPLQIRVGRMAMNWGESIFIKGVNDNARLDVAALRKPGTELKEALLPTYAAMFNLGLPGGTSLEGFYQFKHDPYNIDECGTFWSPVNGNFSTNATSCNAAQIVGGNRVGYNAGRYLAGVATPDSKEDVDGGEFGFAFRFPVEAIDTEFGLYAMNTHSKLPMLDLNVGSDLRQFLVTGGAFASKLLAAAGGVPLTPFQGVSALLGGAGPAVTAALANGTLTPTTGYWLYPEDIKTFGISAATTISGWSVAAELSHQKDAPVLLNAVDMIQAVLNGAGPLVSGQVLNGNAQNMMSYLATGTSLANQTPNTGTVEGWKRVDKTQFQANTLVVAPRDFVGLGNTSGSFLAEVGFQWADLPSGFRFGRGFVYGAGMNPGYNTSTATGVQCDRVGLTAGVQNEGCHDNGFASDFSWGYRVRGALEYSQVFGTNWAAIPSLYIGHDVKGWSIDGQFNEGRIAVNYGLELNLNKEHRVNFNYTTFSNSADYDQFRDHDNYSVSYSYTF